MTRADHLTWAKERALAELDAGSPDNAMTSIYSDLRKHAELADHQGLELGAMLSFAGHLSTHPQVRDWIEGIR